MRNYSRLHEAAVHSSHLVQPGLVTMVQRVVDNCGSLPTPGFYVTSPRLPFTPSFGNKTELNKFTENYGLRQTQKFLRCFTQCQTKNILGKNIGFMSYREL